MLPSREINVAKRNATIIMEGISVNNPYYPFQLQPLSYDYAALEPHFDEKTIRIHHDKHHRAYIDKLNAALKNHPQLHGMTVEELLRNPDRVPEAIRAEVSNNGGGHFYHQLLWTLIGPPRESVPKGQLMMAIDSKFGSIEAFREKFNEVAIQHFASGWTFLVTDARRQSLEICSLPNHERVLGSKTVLLICDVWEHAYYLKYQNRRADYLAGWWSVVNWLEAEHRFERPDHNAELESADESGKTIIAVT